MVENVYPRHCYDDDFLLKIPFLLWVFILIGLRHFMFLTPPGQFLFGSSAEIFGYWYFCISDLIVLTVLIVSGHRVPESTELTRKYWHRGREILLFASLLSTAMVAFFEREALVNTSIWRFEPVIRSLLLDSTAIIYLAFSTHAKDVFMDFPTRK